MAGSGSFKSIWDNDSDSKCSRTSPPRREAKVIPEFTPHWNIVEAYKHAGFCSLNKVQLRVLPCFLNSSCCEDIVICSPPHTGKTSSVVLGILNTFVGDEKYSTAIILAPTYNIAEAIYSCCQTLASFCGVTVLFPPKVKISPDEVKRKKIIFVGTTEKILELVRSSVINLKKVSFLVIDEADCLSNPKKYFDDTLQIHKNLAKSCRSIICTSSLNNAINNFTKAHFYNPINISVSNDVIRKFPIERLCLIYDSRDIKKKVEALKYLISFKSFEGQIVIFCETKEKAFELSGSLHAEEIYVLVLSGQLSQTRRKNVIEEFKQGLIKVIITTRAFASALPAFSSTKLIHYDQVLNENQKLDVSAYKKREFILSKNKKCVEIFFIEDNWKAYLFDKNELLKEESYFNNLVKISCDEISSHW